MTVIYRDDKPVCSECGNPVIFDKEFPYCRIHQLIHEESELCWCSPRVVYQNPETGAKVVVHNSIQ